MDATNLSAELASASHADADVSEIKRQFTQIFGAASTHPLHVVRAPGRVNLIGEHTDYNEGFVFPMAIEPQVLLVCRKTDDAVVRLASTAFPGEIATINLGQEIKRAKPAWANYNRGVLQGLKLQNLPLMGMEALFSNTLPVGGGLSSSAALEVSTAVAMLNLSGLTMEPAKIALLCQKAEHDYAGVPVGIMDQMIVAAGRPGHALLLDCRDLNMRFVPIDPAALRVVIVNSMVKHALTGGEYAQRRAQCYRGVDYFKRSNPAINALRDVTLEQVAAADGKLSESVFRRCRHVVSENARTVRAADLLNAGDYSTVGKLMQESHASLRDDYEVSVPELDFLVEQSMNVAGVYGARMTGGGFGGCIVALVQPGTVEPLKAHLRKVYMDKFKLDPAVYVTTATAGASVLE